MKFPKNIDSFTMNQSLIHLQSIAQKKERTILGLMSGTSADGLDIALCRFSESGLATTFTLKEFSSQSYSDDIHSLLSRYLFKQNFTVEDLLNVNQALTDEWIKILRQTLTGWGIQWREIDLVASHGQTAFHIPSGKKSPAKTLQIVDGDHLANALNTITISDFRQKHIANGFDGAPLAPLGEQLLFANGGTERVFLNLGGIANFTVISASSTDVMLPFATDCGPANTLMNAAVTKYFKGRRYDEGGEIAENGEVSEDLLEMLQSHPFLKRPFPKTTGPEEFSFDWVEECIEKSNTMISPEDLIATLTMFSSRTTAQAIQKYTPENKKRKIYVSGGGWENKTLIRMLQDELPGSTIQSTAELGMPSDAKEAVLFAAFANECVAGKGWLKKDGSRFTMGKVSLPDPVKAK